MKTVIIMRGISGSGKSTMVDKLLDRIPPGKSFTVVSTDQYFIEEDGSYVFKLNKLSEAHADCLYRFLKALEDGVDTIIVDNTNTQIWQLKNYALAAVLARYKVVLKQTHGDEISYAQCDEFFSRNEHGVPLEKIIYQMEGWEPSPNTEKEEWYLDL